MYIHMHTHSHVHASIHTYRCFKATRVKVAQEDLDEEGEDLCNIEFSLVLLALLVQKYLLY
jgi:hypothetical protein